MANLPWRRGAVSVVIAAIVAALVIGLVLAPDLRQPGSPASGEETINAEPGAEEIIAEVSLEDAAPSAQTSSVGVASARPSRPELAPPLAAGLSGAARPAPIASVRTSDNGDAVIAAGLDPNASIEMDSSLKDDEALLACAAGGGGLNAACSIMGRDAGFATLDDMYGVGGDETHLFLDALGAGSLGDQSFATFDTEWVGDNLTPYVEGDQLGIVPDANDGSSPSVQPDTLLGSIGGPQAPGATLPGGGLNSGQPTDRGAGSPPGDTGGAAPGGSAGSAPGGSVGSAPGTGSASGVPDASRVGLGGVPRDDRPSWSSPPSRMALPVEVNTVGDPWNSGPSPAQTPELGSLALFGTGAASMAGYVLVRVRAGRGRRK